MAHSDILERFAPADMVPIARAEDEPMLNVTMVYDDPTTRRWATEMWSQVTQMAGKENISVASWSIDRLAWPEMLEEAVSSAAQANVIVIAVSGAERLPIDLCVWIGAWVPRRARRAGALVALIGLPQEFEPQAFSTQDFMRMVAFQGGLDFFPQERVLRLAATNLFGLEKIKYPAGARALAPA
jgi:hypothetical protein